MTILKYFKYSTIYLLSICVLGFSCRKTYLDENNPSSVTADSYFSSAAGFESLVIGCYPLLIDITQQRFLTLPGTDVFTASGLLYDPINGLINKSGGNPTDTYDTRLNSTVGNLQTYWDYIYSEINRCNNVLVYAPLAKDETEPLKSSRVCEALFLRSLCYFWAVQQWGDIPMPLTPSTTGSLVVTKAKSADVYTQLITDLTQCVKVLPVTQSDIGRPTQGAAKFLLAQVYLTRGWNFNNSLGGTSADFTSSLKLCDEIISSGQYPLESNWNNLWPEHNKNPAKETFDQTSSVAICNASKEVIFAIQYSNPSTWNGDPTTGNNITGNDMHSQYGGGNNQVAQLGRTSDYNRFIPQQSPTPATYRFFDPIMDVRYEGTFNSVCYATTNATISLATNTPYGPNISLTYQRGDTTAIIRPWNNPVTSVDQTGVDIQGGTKPYSVQNAPGNRFVWTNQNIIDNLAWAGIPMFWKFWQPGIEYADQNSTFNDPLFRSAEVYLMAAEAIVKGATGSQLGTADVYYNIVLDRALGSNAGKNPQCAAKPEILTDLTTVSYRASASNISIDMILDERARELLGEGGERWNDLKRTGTLISRAKKYNQWTAYGFNGTPTIDNHHLVRPIPQSMIDNTAPKLAQNPGY
jgi:hypothetical protein